MNSQWGFREKQQRWPPLFNLKLHSHTSPASKTPFRLKIHLKLDVWQWFMYLTVFIKNNYCALSYRRLNNHHRHLIIPENLYILMIQIAQWWRKAIAKRFWQQHLVVTRGIYIRIDRSRWDQYFLKNCLVMF